MDLGRPLSTVTPTLDGDVLAVLAQAETTFTTGQLHRVLGRYSEDGIRKVLMRLRGQGIVLAERVGNAYAYRLNREHLAAGPVIALAHSRALLLERLEAQLAAWRPGPVYAAVFGSAARGDMNVNSDIDILVIRPDDADEDAWEQQVTGLAAQVTRWTGNDARPLQFAVGEVGDHEPVLRDVLRDGLTVAGTRAWLSTAMRSGTRR
ncbi:MAG: nucleotidyltransferase domain-containing protein [Actinomycetota bacterium]|nr:nucleotidyltransferase domain-containing protein [Actinomycetota bacterium]MDA8209534.1 nucleotidyltransferase domain-containing protein [Actinomycetota bacterium]